MATAEERDLARRAWDRTASGVTGVPEVFKPLRERFVKAITEGQPLDDLENDLIEQLAVREWTWEWFDQWYKVFSEGGAFPAAWPPMAPEPDEANPFSEAELAEYRRAAIASLIVPTAAMVFFRDRRLGKATGREKWTLATDEDVVAKRVAKDKQLAITQGEFDSLPPFFPGDTTSLRAVKLPGPRPQDDARPSADGGDEGAMDVHAAAAAAAAALISEVTMEAALEDDEGADAPDPGEAGGDEGSSN